MPKRRLTERRDWSLMEWYFDITFLPDGIFSVDGIHPNPKGHAVVANEIIKVINSSFDATIPLVDTTPYRTILTPPPM